MLEEKFPYPRYDEDENGNVPTPPKDLEESFSSQIISFATFTILIIIVIWGLLHIATLTSPWLSSIFSRRSITPTIVKMTAPINTTLSKPILTKPKTPNTIVGKNTNTKNTSVYRPADLSVHILAIGVIDYSTGAFVNRKPNSKHEMIAVQFNIINNGGSSTGSWYFSAQLPTTPAGYTYNSPVQEPLGPGDHIINTLRFTQVTYGGGIFNVIVDSEGMVKESDEVNNISSQFISVLNYY